MSDRIPTTILKVISRNRWAMLEEYLHKMVSIVKRESHDIDAVLSSSAVRRESGLLTTKDGVAILNVGGVIMPYASLFTEISGAVSIETLALRFGEAIRDNKVKAIILSVDSPGGDINSVNEFSKLIYESRHIKPIIAYVSAMSCSAAYWISSACSHIVADETAVLGSIGVIATAQKNNEDDETIEIVSSQSPYKRLDVSTDEGKGIIQKEINALCDIFIEKVALYRNKTTDYVAKEFGEGGTMLARQAVKKGMADEIDSLEGIITKLNKGGLKMAGTKAEDIVDEKDKEEEIEKVVKDDDKDKDCKDAIDETEEEKEEKETKTNKKDASVNLYMKGVQDERKRIEALIDISPIQGMTDLIKNAMFKEPITAGDLAVQILKAEREQQQEMLDKYKADAGNIPNIQRSSGSDLKQEAIKHQQSVDLFKKSIKGE